MRGIELFAGCGGLALGMAKAGVKHELIVECDPQATETLASNKLALADQLKHWHVKTCRTEDIDFSQFDELDIISGGPPCQPFSIGGNHLGQNDPRNMWPEAIRAVREARPKAFVFENVRGLLRPDFEKYFAYINFQLSYPQILRKKGEKWSGHLVRLRQHAISKAGREALYRVVACGINAADYGASQKRHRAIIMGVRTDITEDWAFPQATHSQETLVWSKHISRKYWKRHGSRPVLTPSSASEGQILKHVLEIKKKPPGLPWVTVRDALADLPPPRMKPEIQGHWQHPGARTYPNHSGSVPDEPAKALKAGVNGVPGGENMLVNGRGNPRYFTVREMARLQGLPDDFVITGSWKAATRQLGNAVPTVIGKVLGDHIGAILAKHSIPLRQGGVKKP
jgi:DNA (cytosine-5)-methyltransferase 1